MSIIVSPMSTGNGAYVVHKSLEAGINDYRVISYSPYLTLIPFLLYVKGRCSKTDLIHTAPDYGLFHSRRGKPLVLTFHNYVLDRFMRDYSSLLQNIHYRTDLRWFIKKSVERAKVITAVSYFTADLVGRELGISSPIKVIYNGVDQKRFCPNRQSRESDNKVNVLFCGNLSVRKGVQWLLPILNNLAPNIHVYYTAGLRNKSNLPKRDRIHCLGRIKHEEMHNVYNDMDILLFPTVREGFGLAAAEAMACGLPVVATDCSSLPELIDSGKGGYLCPLGDVNFFAEKINLLADNISLRREFGEYNRAKVEELFTLERMVNDYKNLFEEILS